MPHLPQLSDAPFLTDGGIETTLIFQMGHDLPLFAAYPLLASETGRESLRTYFRSYLGIAERRGLGFVLESPTWRCSTGWGAQLGHDAGRDRAIQPRRHPADGGAADGFDLDRADRDLG